MARRRHVLRDGGAIRRRCRSTYGRADPGNNIQPRTSQLTAPTHQGLTSPPAKMKWLSTSLALAGSAQAALRFGCSTLSIQRIDPLVEPGKVPSAHLHQIVGGNVFNATMDIADGDIGDRGSCTTCTFSEDFSNYWTAVMFFKHANGTYKRVPIMQNTALPNGINGGMTVYYTQQDFFNNGNQKITAFPPVSSAHPFSTAIREDMLHPQPSSL